MSKFNLKRENTMLMIIDIQDRLLPVMYDRETIIKNVEILIEGSETLGLPIIATEQYPKGLGETVEEINSLIDRENVFAKNSFTAYIGEAERRIKDLDKENIVIAGMETHICVFQTARDLINAGYNVHIVSDAMASRTIENYKNGIELLRDMGAIITNTETVLFDLLKVAGSNEFKIISKLIK